MAPSTEVLLFQHANQCSVWKINKEVMISLSSRLSYTRFLTLYLSVRGTHHASISFQGNYYIILQYHFLSKCHQHR